MPVLHNADDEEAIYISIMTRPREDLPEKEWQVELEPSKTVADLKALVLEEYLIAPEAQRLCSTGKQDAAGLKDHVRISDLPVHPDHSDVKKVYLMPSQGFEQELLDGILEWAKLADFYDEYEGCVDKGDEEGRGSIIGRSSLLNRLSTASRHTFQASKEKMFSAPSGMMGAPSGVAPGKRASIELGEGGEMTLTEPDAPMVQKMGFNLACSCLCALNVLVVGLEADYTCWGLDNCPPADRMSWYALDCVFAVLFVIEMALRIGQEGVHYFRGDHGTSLGFDIPNTVDFIVVVLRCMDTFIFDQVGLDTNLKILSCFRIMQFARVARLMRLVRSVRELWLVVAGLADLGKTVVWVMILLVMIFWVVGIMMTIIIGHSTDFFDYNRSHWGKSEYFNTVPKAAYSLFQIMTLSQWSTVMIRPVFEQYPAIIMIMIPFMCITTVGLLNIIVGVVVETTLLSASTNAEKEAKESQKLSARIMESLKMVFEEADTDGGGTLDKEELRRSMKKPHVRDRLKVLDIPIKDLDQLFDVLDVAGVGEVQTDKFFRGCARLRGPAMACDLHRMSVDFSRYISWTDTLQADTESMNTRLRSLLDDMESVDRDIIKGESDDLDPVLGKRRERSMKQTTNRKLRASQAAQGNMEERTTRIEARKGSKCSVKTSNTGGSKRRPSLMSRTLSHANLGGKD